MSASYYLMNKLIDHQLGKTSFTMPTVYVGMSSTTPAQGSPVTNITEPSTGSYARVATSGATWTAAASGTTSNAAVITFPTATADWVAAASLTYGILYDASSAGNILGYGVLTVAKNVLNGDTASIAIGALTVTIT
jgi:hypothetical protein